VWTSKGLSDRIGFGPPIVFEVGGIRQYAVLTTVALVAVRADTGAPLWSYKRPADRHSATTPVYSEGCIYAFTGEGTGGGVAKLEVNGGAVTATQIWETKDMDCYHGGYVLVNGYIYGNHKNGWACLDMKTGQTKWKVQPRAAPGVGKGAITYADGMLYTLGEEGVMGLAEANPNEYKPVSSFRLPTAMSPDELNANKPKDVFVTNADGLKGPNPGRDSWAHPVISNGKLFLRMADKLFVYSIKK